MIASINDALGQLWQKLEGWLDAMILMVPNFVLALVFFTAVVFASRFMKKYMYRLMERISDNRAVNKLLSTILTTVFILIGMFVALSILNLDKAVTSLLAGAGVIGLAIGLAFQEPIINTISGIIMSIDKPMNLHDLVETNGYFGTITQISLRATHVRLFSGEKVVIPNKLVLQNPFTNFTINGERRVEIDCGVSYGDDLEKVREVAIKAIEENVQYDRSKPVEVFFGSFGASSIDFQLRFWIDLSAQQQYLEARNDAIIAIKKAFDANGIAIPFPIRTLDFGIKGGVNVKDAVGPMLQSAN